MTDQALYLRLMPGVTSCCSAIAAVEVHRQDGLHDIYCAACLGNVSASGHVRRLAFGLEWPWTAPATPTIEEQPMDPPKKPSLLLLLLGLLFFVSKPRT